MRRLFGSGLVAFAAVIFCVAGSTTAMAGSPEFSLRNCPGTILGRRRYPPRQWCGPPGTSARSRSRPRFLSIVSWPTPIPTSLASVVGQYFTGALIGRITRAGQWQSHYG